MATYEAKKGDGETWVVVNTETEEIRETHEPPEAEEKAKRQARLMNSISDDEGWSGDES